MTRIEGLPQFDCNLALDYNLSFGVNPDNFNKNLNGFFRITHYSVEQEHLSVNKIHIDVCFVF